ncbi:MAG: HEAT repeat domain-containing protein [Desulfuromusa sp.]|nr:HEAT repeat domain-containing protein [Desulfuromusa sp.]
MKQKTTVNPTLNSEKPLLTGFLHELNISRRQLSLYPPEHPQIATSVKRTMDILEDLFRSNPVITLGIAPDALYFEQLWLDKKDSTHQEFAKFFSGIGIASISFRWGLDGAELIRFNQLLCAKRENTKSLGDLDQLFEQHRIEHIAVLGIDYDAFQASPDFTKKDPAAGKQLWENFLHGLHSGILDFGDLDSTLEIGVIADIFNQKLVGNQTEREQSSHSINLFIENSIRAKGTSQSISENDKKLTMLLDRLTPAAQQEFLNNTFQALEKHRDQAPEVLQKIPRQLLQNSIIGKDRQALKLSSRLFGLINKLATGQNQTEQRLVKTTATPLSEQMVRARLDVLFSEEQQEQYLPDSYQSALHDILNDNITGTIPEAEKEKLRAQIENQSAEENCTAIIFELLQNQLEPEHEKAVEQNLLELSRFFLDVGDFINLRKIYTNWSQYLDNRHSAASIFDEKVLSNHTQSTFMAEVLDGIDLWGEEKHQEITDYVIVVGEPYSESVIEYLGQAREWLERQLWMKILEGIGGDAQQMIEKFLTDERWYLVRNLLIILGKDLGPRNLKVIHKLLNHPHPKVRLEVVRNLLSCNPATANRQLSQELDSPDPEAQSAAVQIADLSQDLNVLSILHKMLGTPVNSDIELELKKQIVKTLTRIGNQESLPVLRRILQKQGIFVSRRIKQLQIEILDNLTIFPGASADKLLQELAGGKYKQQVKLITKQRRDYFRRGQ